MHKLQITLALALAATGVCFAQALPGPPPETKIVSDGAFGAVRVMSGQFSFEDKVVKGQPYTADAVTETTQVLGDGNRITRKETAAVARDSEGRTRREQTLNGIGPWSTPAEPHKIVFINDPAAQVNYVLEPNHIARKISVGMGNADEMKLKAKLKAEIADRLSRPDVDYKLSATSVKTEQLGSQIVEGVQADGTRTTTTIPAGQIGNERPIEMTSERWYSPELQTVIMTKSSDPRTGDTTYRLTNIQRVEPPASMFEVPSDYKIEEGPKNAFFFRDNGMDGKK